MGARPSGSRRIETKWPYRAFFETTSLREYILLFMAGHSKWAQIKRKKAINDNKKGKVVTKYMRLIAAAARAGGSADPSINPSLRNLIEAAKYEDVPNDNIDRLLKRLAGGDDAEAQYEEINYEGYAPGGVALIVSALTNNRVRTIAEVRHAFSKNGGSIGTEGAVSWQFDKRGYMWVDGNTEATQEAAMDAGALDIQESEDGLELYTETSDIYRIVEELRGRKLKVDNIEITMVPQNTMDLSTEDAAKVMKLVDALEGLDDVQSVYTNLNMENLETEE